MQTLRRELVISASLSAALTFTGCLASSYRVPEGEMERLARTDPDKRGESVRVVQRLSWDDPPPEAPHREHDCRDHSHYRGGVHVHAHHVRVRGGRSSGGASSSGGGGGKVDDGKALAALVVVGAAFFTVGLVATEGARYDGWAHVEADHPVHLMYPDGSVATVALSQLEPEDLEGSYEAVIRQHHGLGLGLGRPESLSRQGLSWKFEMGSMELAPPGGARPIGLAAQMALGFFPTQHVGVLGFLTLSGDTHDGADVLALRYGAEVQAMPLRLGSLHLGGFGAAGLSYDGIEGPGTPLAEFNDTMFSAGAMAELEVSTRLALSLRAGATWFNRDDGLSDPTFMVTLGVAVY